MHTESDILTCTCTCTPVARSTQIFLHVHVAIDAPYLTRNCTSPADIVGVNLTDPHILHTTLYDSRGLHPGINVCLLLSAFRLAYSAVHEQVKRYTRVTRETLARRSREKLRVRVCEHYSRSQVRTRYSSTRATRARARARVLAVARARARARVLYM